MININNSYSFKNNYNNICNLKKCKRILKVDKEFSEGRIWK